MKSPTLTDVPPDDLIRAKVMESRLRSIRRHNNQVIQEMRHKRLVGQVRRALRRLAH